MNSNELHRTFGLPPDVKHGVFGQPNDGEWLQPADRTVAAKHRVTSKFIKSDSPVRLDQFSQSGSFEPIGRHIPTEHIVTLSQLEEWVAENRICRVGALIRLNGRDYISILVVPHTIQPANIDYQNSELIENNGETFAFRLTDHAGKRLGVTEKYYLVGPDAREVNTLHLFGKL